MIRSASGILLRNDDRAGESQRGCQESDPRAAANALDAASSSFQPSVPGRLAGTVVIFMTAKHGLWDRALNPGYFCDLPNRTDALPAICTDYPFAGAILQDRQPYALSG